MTILDVADKLNVCANGSCRTCEYFGNGCTDKLIEDMADECRRIGEERNEEYGK